jgi:hypothetical protein
MPDNFKDAMATFREFLRNAGLPEQIIWLSPADAVLIPGRALYIRSQPPEIGVARAHENYDRGMAAKLGVMFAALCKFENATCCFVWVPSDANEAQRSLMPKSGGLKMRAPATEFRLRVKSVRNSIYWKILQTRHREGSDLRDFLFS